MVAVVSGSGLGLLTAPRSGQDGANDARLGRGNESVFVNTQNGNLIVQGLDENLSALGLDGVVVRTYNSQGQVDDDNNDGWRHGMQQRLVDLNGTLNSANSFITKVFGDGSRIVYRYNASLGYYLSTDGDGAHDTLLWNGTNWTWTDANSRVVETYDWVSSIGRIQNSKDANSNTVVYRYNGAGLLDRARMAGAITQDIYFDYYTTAGNTTDLEKIHVEAPDANGVMRTQTLTRYTYDSQHRLVTVTTDMTPGDNVVADNDTYVTTYTYEGTSYRIASITQKRGTSANVIATASFTYLQVGGTGAYRVRTYTDGEGRVNTFNYTETIAPGGNSAQNVTPGWSVPVNVGDENGRINGGIPRVEFDAEGNGMMLYMGGGDATGTNSDMLVRRYDRATNTWAPSTILDTLGDGRKIRNYQLSVDDAGNALAVWSQSDGTASLVYTVYVSRFTKATGLWTTSTVQSLGSSVANNVDGNSMPALSAAIRNANAAAVSWIQSDGTANSVWVSRWNGTSWVTTSSPIEAGTNHARQTSSAIDTAGNVAVTWTQTANGGSVENVWYNYFNVTTGAWAGPQSLQTTAGTSQRAQVAFDWTGNALFAWVQDGDVLARRLDKATLLLGAVTTLDARTETPDSPTIAMDRQTGAGFVAWIQSDGTSMSVYARKFTNTGAFGSWTAPAELIDSTTEAVNGLWQQNTPSLVASMRGDRGVVMWCQEQTLGGVNHIDDVMAARLVGGSWQAPEHLVYNAGPQGGFFNGVAVDAQGNVTTAWGTAADPGLWVSRYTAPSQWTGAMSISDPGNDSYFVKSGSDANGNIVAIWESAGSLKTRRYDKATNTWSVEQTLDPNASAFVSAISVDEFGNAVAVWQRNPGTGLELRASRYDVLTNSWSPSQLILGGAQPADIIRPGGFAVQVSGQNAVIAWLQKNGSIYDVYAARLTGTTLTGPTPMETAGGTATYVSATIDRAGNIGVAWQQFDNTAGVNIDRVYTNRFTAGGAWSGASSMSATTTAATAPQIGYDAAGNGLAIWSQGNDVYANRYTAGVGWGATPAPIDNVNGVAESTTLSVDRGGNAIAAWIQTDAGGIKSLYAARYTLGSGWSPAVLLETSSQVVRTNPGTAAVVVATAIHGDNAAVGWLQKTGAGDPSPVSTEAWVNRWNGSAWIGPEMVSNTPGVHAFNPTLSIDNQGNTSVLYYRYADRSQVFVNRYSVNTPFSGEVQFGPRNATVGIVRTAYDVAGNGFAVWSGNLSGTTTMWASRYVKATNTWSAPFALDSSTTGSTDWRPSLSVDAAGNAVAAWARHDGTHYNLYVARWSARDGRWSAAVAVDGATQAVANSNITDLATSISAENNIAVAWLQGTGTGGVNDVYVARWNGISWSPAGSPVDSRSEAASNVSVAIDLDGNVIATWLQNETPGINCIFQNRYTATNATTGSWGTASSIDTVLPHITRQQIGMDAAGNAIAAWVQGTDVYARHFDRAAGVWTPPVIVNTGTNNPEVPALAVDTMGNAVLAWIRNDGTANSVYVSTFTAGGSWSAAALLENSSLIAPTGNGAGMGNPAVSIRGTRAVVSWAQRGAWSASPMGTNFYQARWNGTSWSAAEQLDNTAELNGGFMGTVSTDYDGSTVAHFSHWQSTTSNTFSNRYTANNSYTQTTVSDAFGRVTTYQHDSAGRLVSVTTPAVNGERNETRFQYDADGNIVSVTENARGQQRVTAMIYDSRGNLVITRAPNGNTTRRVYDAFNQLGSETVYLLPDLNGGPAQPPLTTRFVYDDHRNLRFVISADGRVTEHRYDAAFLRVNSYVYTATLYSATAFALADLTTWTGTAANQADAQVTDYGYDLRGNVNVLKTYAASAALTGTGTAAITRFTYDQRGLLLNKTNPRGEATGAADHITTYQYDAMRRVTSEVEWLSTIGAVTTTRTTSYTHDDVNNSVRTTLANGLVTTAVYDRSGRLLTSANSSGATTFGTTTYSYDPAGRLAMVTLPVGNASGTTVSPDPVRTFIIYDEMGRKSGEVDGNGTLTQFFYKPTGELIKTIRYSSLLPGATLANLYTIVNGRGNAMKLKPLLDALATVPGRDAGNDQVIYHAYDSAGRLAATVEILMTVGAGAVGGITRFHYNGGRLTDSVSYAYRPVYTPNAPQLTLAEIDASIAPYVNFEGRDRRTRNFYDRDGNLIATLDAEGYLTESKYDSAGRLIKTIRYANVTPAANPALADLAALRPAVDNANQYSATPDDEEQDIVTRFYYDARGRSVGELDGEGYLTERLYDLDGNVSRTSRYEYKFDPVAITDTTTLATLKQSVTALTGLGVAAQVTQFEYDGAGRVTKTTELTGTSWSDPDVVASPTTGTTLPFLAFDSAGNGFLVTTTTAAATGERTDVMVRRYDAASKQWGPATMLDTGAGFIWNVTVSMDDAGNAVAAWSQSDGSGLYSVYAARYTPAGGWLPAVALESTNDQVDYYSQPKLSTAIANANNAAVAWVQHDGTNYSTYVSRWNGSAWAAARLDNNTSASGATTEVSVAIDSSGRTTAVWLETNGGATVDIRYARYQSGAWGAATPLDSAATARSYAQVAFDASGNGFAVWVQGTQVMGRRFTVAGGWGTAAPLSSAANTNQSEKPTLAISGTGEAVVAWAQGIGSGAPPLSLHVTRWNGSSWSAPIQLENSAEPVVTNWQQASRAVFVAMRGSQAAIGWMQHQPVGSTLYSNSDIMVSRWNGTGWDRAEAVEQMANGWGAFFLSVAIDAQGNTFAAHNNMDGTWQTKIVRNDAGVVTTLEYDHMDAVTKTVRAAGTNEARTAQARYDVLGRKTQELSAEGAARIAAGMDVETAWTDFGKAYAYDNAGRLVSSTQRVNGTSTPLTTRYYYDADGRVRFVIDPRGQVRETQYDALGNVSSEIGYYAALSAATRDSLTGGLLSASLETTLRQTASTALDARTNYTRNTRGQVLARTTAAGANTTLHYNAFGEVDFEFTYFDATNYRRHDYLYDRRGSLTTTKWDPLGINATELRAYDSFGRLKQVTDARTNVTRFEYDRLGRQIATVDALNVRRRSAYDAFSRTTSTFDAYNNETKYLYNDATRRVIVTTPEGVSVATEYNRHGETLRVTNTDTTTVYTYDANGALKSASDGLGALENRLYDSVGREIRRENARGVATTFAYDASNRLLSRTVDPTGLNLTTSYLFGSDATSQFVDTTEPGGRVTRTRYDQDGRTTVVISGFGSEAPITTAYQYDAANRTVLVTARPGTAAVVRTQYKYDNLGRRIEEIVDPIEFGGTLNLSTRYRYDANGNVTRKIDSRNVSTWFVYDTLNRVTHAIDGAGGVTVTTYDNESRVTSTRTYTAAINVSSWTNLDAPTTSNVTLVTSANDQLMRSFYDRDGRATYGIDGVGTVTQRTFDTRGNVTRARRVSALQLTGNYADAAAVTSALGAAANTLAAADQVSWTAYDLRGRAEFTVDSMNGVNAAVRKFTYDANGNVIAERGYFSARAVNPAGNSLATLRAWDTANASATDDHVTLFWYDSADRQRFVLDAEGYVTQNRYDDTTRASQTTRYATRPSGLSAGSTIAQVGTAIVTHIDDRTKTMWVDATDRVRFVLDGEGYLTETQYNDNTGAVTRIAYAAKPGGPQAISTTLATMVASRNLTPARDRSTTSWVDAANRQRFMLDAENYLTETRYHDTNGSTTVYAYLSRQNQFSAASTLANLTAANAITLNANDENTREDYDAAGRLWRVTDSHLKSEFFVYDGAGNRTKFVNKKAASPTDAAYTWTYEYDANARLIVERSPNVLVTTVTESGGTFTVTADASVSLVTRTNYDFFGNVTSRVEAEGLANQARTTSWEYDALGRQIASLSPTIGIYDATTGDSQTGGAGAVSRTEISTAIRTEVGYDVFGNAFRNRQVLATQASDAAKGVYTYKAYDRLDRARYDIDNKKYVTEHVLDAFGSESMTIRYANARNGAALPSTGIGGLRLSDATNGLTADGVKDRAVYRTYDHNGHARTTKLTGAWSYLPTADGSPGALVQTQPTVEYFYNAFGEANKVREFVMAGATSTWANSFKYYDRRGLTVGAVDPANYYTRFDYDGVGNLSSQTEFALKNTDTIDETTFGTVNASANGADPGSDRVINYAYDQLNRRISETRVNFEYSNSTGSVTPGFTTAAAAAYVKYGYDALGNQTRMEDALGGVTYTFFDVLGRAIAVATPTRDRGESSQVAGYSRMLRDAHGVLAQQIEYYNGLAVGAIGAGDAPALPAAPAANALDRVTTIASDKVGHALAARNALNKVSYSSYNERGDIAKEWQPVVNPNNPAVTETRVIVYRYDEVGQLTQRQETQRAGAAPVTRNQDYNGFGEVTLAYNTGAPGSDQEYFHYDQQGRLWRTNGGDGVDKIILYDLAGRTTLEVRSQNTDLANGAWTNANAALTALAGIPTANVMRTETVYDIRGNAIEQRSPTFELGAALPAAASTVSVGVNSSFTVNPSHFRVHWTPATMGQRVYFGYRLAGTTDTFTEVFVDKPSNSLHGANINGLDSRLFEYRIAYFGGSDPMALSETMGTFQLTRTTTTTANVTVDPQDPASQIPSVLGTYTNGIVTWAAPPAPAMGTIFRAYFTVAGIQVQATLSGGILRADLTGITALRAAGTHTFTIEHLRDGVLVGKNTGSLTSDGIITTVTAQNPLNFAPPSYNTPIVSPQIVSGGQVGARVISVETGTGVYPTPGTTWSGTNIIDLTWGDIGAGAIRVEIVYDVPEHYYYEPDPNNPSEGNMILSPGWDNFVRTFDFTNKPTGARLEWAMSSPLNEFGGFENLHVARVKRQINGVWTTILEQANPPLDIGRSMSWTAPAQPIYEEGNITPRFEWRVNATGSYTTVTPSFNGTVYGVNLSNFQTGNYDYILSYLLADGRVLARQTGTFVLNDGTTGFTVTTTVAPQNAPAATAPITAITGTGGANTISWSNVTSQGIQATEVVGQFQDQFSWVGGNSVRPTWTGGGNSGWVVIEYITSGEQFSGTNESVIASAEARTWSGTMTRNASNGFQLAESGGGPYWASQFPVGGVSSISRMRVYTAQGGTLIADSANPTGPARTISWAAPASEPGITARVWYNNGSTLLGTATRSGNTFSIVVEALPAGANSILIEYTRADESWIYLSTRATLTQSTSTPVVSNIIVTNRDAPWFTSITGNSTSGTIGWSGPALGSGHVAYLQYKSAPNTWTTWQSWTTGSSFSYNLSALATTTATNYEFRILYMDGVNSWPYLRAQGSVTLQRFNTATPASVTLTGTPVNTNYPAEIILPTVNASAKRLEWTRAKNDPSDRIVVKYTTPFVTGGQEFPVTPTAGANGLYYIDLAQFVGVSNREYRWEIKYYSGASQTSTSYARAWFAHGLTVSQSAQPTLRITSQSVLFPSQATQISTPVFRASDRSLYFTAPALALADVRFRLNAGLAGETFLTVVADGAGYRAFLPAVMPAPPVPGGPNEYVVELRNSSDQLYGTWSGDVAVITTLGSITGQNITKYSTVRPDNTLEIGMSIGVRPIVDPPYAVYSLADGGFGGDNGTDELPDYPALGAARWGTDTTVGGGGWYKLAENTTLPPPYDRFAHLTESQYHYYDNHLTLSWERDDRAPYEYKFEYWPSGTPADVRTLDVCGPDFSYWAVDVHGVASGTYGWRITRRHTGSPIALGTREGTFTRGATNSVTVGSPAFAPGPVATPKTKQEYDRWNNVTKAIDAAGNETKFRYNSMDKVVRTTEALDLVIDRQVSASTPVSTQAEKRNYFDLLGRLIETQDGYDQANRATYNLAGQILTQRNADAGRYGGAVSRSVYDIFGNVTQTVDQLGYITRNKYDAMGRLTEVWREIELNKFANKNLSTDFTVVANGMPFIQKIVYEYDDAGRRVKEINGANEETRYFYDLAGNIVSRQAPTGSMTYDYDPYGNEIQETDALGSTRRWTYDAFQRVQTHVELTNTTTQPAGINTGGLSVKYTYNDAGSLTWQRHVDSNGTLLAGLQNIAFAYDNAGHLKTIADAGAERVTSYRFDAAGRQVRETVLVTGKMHQDTRISYDAHNRVRNLSDPDYALSITYDVNGMRGQLRASYLGDLYGQDFEDIDYEYDEMNRVTRMVLDTGREVSFMTDTVQEVYEYNARGERTKRTALGQYWGQKANGDYTIFRPNASTPPDPIEEIFQYDGLGRLKVHQRDLVTPTGKTKVDLHSYTYDGASRVKTDYALSIENDKLVKRKTTNEYTNGRLFTQDIWKGKLNETDAQLNHDQLITYGRSIYSTATADAYNKFTIGFDDAGNLRGYKLQIFGDGGYTTTYRSKFELGGSYLEKNQNASSSKALNSGDTTRYYNVNHELVKFTDEGTSQQAPHQRRDLVNNQSGQVLTALKGIQTDLDRAWDESTQGTFTSTGGGRRQYYFYWQNQLIGSMGAAPLDGLAHGKFDVNSTSISGNQNTPDTVVAQAGDTLRILAGRIYGDSGLWYLIAQENGLTEPDEALVVGTELRIPNRVVSLSNSSDSFKPFNAADVLGDLTPTQKPKAPKGCGMLGMIIMIVVMVVVTIFTAGAAAPGAASLLAAAGTTGAGAVFSAGLAVLSGSAVAAGSIGLGAAMFAAGIGAAAGSIVSQGVGIAIGNQDKFDWKQVGISALTAGVTAGLGGIATGVAKGVQMSKFLTNTGKFLNAIGKAGQAAVGSALSQGLAVATKMQSSFSWNQVAVAAISAPVKDFVGGVVGGAAGNMGRVGAFLGDFAGNVATGYVAREFGGKMTSEQVWADAFGNAIASSIVDLAAKDEEFTGDDTMSIGARIAARTDHFWERNFGALARGRGSAVVDSVERREAEMLSSARILNEDGSISTEAVGPAMGINNAPGKVPNEPAAGSATAPNRGASGATSIQPASEEALDEIVVYGTRPAPSRGPDNGRVGIPKFSVFTKAMDDNLTARLKKAEDSGDTAEYNRLRLLVSKNILVSSMQGYPVTQDQRDAVAGRDTIAYWKSVYDQSGGKQGRIELIGWGQGDYVGATKTESALAGMTWKSMSAAVDAHNALLHDDLTMEQLGVEFAAENLRWRDEDMTNTPHLLSREQLANMHFAVMDRHNLRRNNFGGTPIFGVAGEAEFFGPIWADHADVDTNRRLFLDWAWGDGPSERYYGPDALVSKNFSQSFGAYKMEAALLRKYQGNVPADGFMYNVDSKFSWEEGFKDLWPPNAAAEQIGSYQNGFAVVKGDTAYFRVVNTMGRNSFLLGRPLKDNFGWNGASDIPSHNGVRTAGSNMDITIVWTRKLTDLARQRD